MFQAAIRYGVGVTLLILLLPADAAGQEYRLPYVKTPETPLEFWQAVHTELHTGKHKRAGEMLANFYNKFIALAEAEQNDLLLKLYDEGVSPTGDTVYQGISSFLRLSNIADLRTVRAKDPEGGKDVAVVDLLVGRVSQLVSARLGDAKRIEFFIGNLGKSEEERAYAVAQLRLTGARAVPYMVSVLRTNGRAAEHQPVLNALRKMNRDIGPPLFAAFAAKDPQFRSLLIGLFLQRADDRVLPYLWYLHGLQDQPEIVRQQASNALSRFLRLPAKELGSPRAMLTRAAERYYRHEEELPPGEQLTIWRWNDATGLASQPATRSQYEEYYGVHMAKLALGLDPAYRPAQIILLSLLLEKAHERGGLEQPLAKAEPELNQLLAATNSDLLEAVLAKAIAEGRTAVVLGAVRSLAHSGHNKLVRSTERGLPPLLRALSYPDRRVQFAAAEAVLHLPTTEPFTGASRVVEVFRRALNAESAPKALIGYLDTVAAQKLAGTLRQLGYEPVVASTGKEVMRSALGSAGVEIIFLEPRLADPNLPYLLGQLRGNPDTAGVPVVVLTPKEEERAVRSAAERYPRVLVIAPAPVSPEMLQALVEPLLKDKFRPPLSPEERKAQTKTALDWLLRLASGGLPGYDVRPAEPALLRALTDDEWAAKSAEILVFVPGRPVQTALAELALNNTRPASVRTEAAKQLRVHLDRYGILLKPEQIGGLVKLPEGAEDPALKEEFSRLAAGLQADAGVTGSRLREFNPVPRPPAAEAPKDGQK